MSILTVADLMTDKVFSIHADEDLARLNNLMDDFHVRHVPVVDDEGNILGIVSQRDLIRTALFTDETLPESQKRDLLKNMTVREVMVTGAETAEADEEIEEAGRLMLENKLGCLPVVDGTKLIGILTEADFVKYVVNHAAEA
jgi:CBS domain-containing membrane protein